MVETDKKHSSQLLTPQSKSTEARLRALIEADQKIGAVVTSRGNKINRAHYADRLGRSTSALSRYSAVFEKYEKQLKVATGPLRHLEAMRHWLTAAYDARELEIRDGEVDRRALQAHFKLRGGTFLTRYPSIRALIDEFDARAKSENYLPAKRQAEFDRMVAALNSCPLLNKNRLTVNLVELARASGVPRDRLFRRPYADCIEATQSKIRLAAETSKIDPFVNGRVYPFSHLPEAWSRRFLDRIGVRFKQVASGMRIQTLKQPYLQLVNLLRWIGSSTNPPCCAVVADSVEHGRIVSASNWEEALFAYRDHLISCIRSGSKKDISVDAAIKALRIALNRFCADHITPPTSIPLPGLKYTRRRSGHLRSIAEVGVVTSGNSLPPDYVAFAKDRLLEAAKAASLDWDEGEGKAFLHGLAEELKTSIHPGADPALAIRLVLERRLDALRKYATAIVNSAATLHQQGLELIARSQIDVPSFEAGYLGAATGSHERKLIARELFPNPKNVTNAQAEQGLANLLALIDLRHNGIPPLARDRNAAIYGQFFAKRYLVYGGIEKIAPLLNPSPDAVGAALTLYLIESGSNVDVGRTLSRECIEVSDLEGHVRITGRKPRAHGKPIIVDLPESLPAVQAIRWLLSAGHRLKAAAASDADKLFLMRIGSDVQLMTPHWYTDWFKRFVTSIAELENLSLLPNMIRPSVLLLAALRNEGRLTTGMAIAQHGIVVTQGYQQKWPTRLIYDENIRRFQDSLEILVLSNIDDAASKMGIPAAQFEARLSELRATGLGTFCKDMRGRPGEQRSSCSTIDCWNDCPHLLIVAEVEAIATLQLWQSSLRIAQPEWERDRVERWEQVWLPWLCLTNVVEEKMVRGPLIRNWKEAQLRAAELSARPGYFPPMPW